MSLFTRGAFPCFVALAIAVASCAKPVGENCDLNSDCLKGTCQDGTCVRECADSELDCPIGYVCNDVGRCEYGGGSGGSTGATTTANGGASTTSTTSSGGATTTDTTSTTSSTTTSTGSGMGLADLTLCGSDPDCDSSTCRAMTPNGQKRCTHACSDNAQCPSGLRCEGPSTASSVCVFSDVGKPCSGVGQCNFACLSPVNYCVSECTTGADCPNGYGCMLAAGAKVCIKVEADCAADTSQCVVPAACDTSPNLVVSSCTIACGTAADCPQRAAGLAPWTCDGLCRRPGDVYGPLSGGFTPAQWACNATANVVNVCNDGLHIDFTNFTQPSAPSVSCASPTTTDGLGGDACLDSCRYQGACSNGFACAAVAELTPGQRIGLCMPRGGGEVGSSCTSNGNCVFGLCDTNHCSRDCTKDGVCPEGSNCTAVSGAVSEGLPYKTCQ